MARCLVRCPEKRIDFPDFFSHPFLDLEHLPDEDSFQKASQLVMRAVTADKDKDYETAIKLYQESLDYFLPILHYETDIKKRDKLQSTVSGYQRRCRELRSRAPGGGERAKHHQLLALCRTSSHLMTGVEICIQGEDYLSGGEFDMALDRSVVVTVAPSVVGFINICSNSESRLVWVYWYRLCSRNRKARGEMF